MDIEEFLKEAVEGYLLHDLESMAKVTVPPDEVGALGNSMMAITFAGIELLGWLLFPNDEPYSPGKRNKSNEYFLNYWDNYLVKEQPIYRGLGRLFRNLLRHGIAHNFLAKPGIFIEKGTGRRTFIDRTKQELYIDCLVFFGDFQKSYYHRVRPIMDRTAKFALTSVANMQSRLDSMVSAYIQDAKKAFSSLSDLDLSLQVDTSGANIVNINSIDPSSPNEYPSPAPTGMRFTSPPDTLEGITIIHPD